MKKFFTSESVTEGHPDKVCDNISDGILDAILAQDPTSRVAIECSAGFDTLFIMGEVTTTAEVDYEQTARKIIKNIGYDFGSFAYDKCKIITAIHTQSPDIAMGVNASCWVDTTTVSMRFTVSPSYSTVTWVFPSGRR